MSAYMRHHLRRDFLSSYDSGILLQYFAAAMSRLLRAEAARKKPKTFTMGVGSESYLRFKTKHECLVFFCETEAIANFLRVALPALGFPGSVVHAAAGEFSNPDKKHLVVYSLMGVSLLPAEPE